MAVTISDSQGGAAFVKSMIRAVLDANPARPPQFLIGGSAETIEAVRSEIQTSQLTAKQKNSIFRRSREFQTMSTTGSKIFFKRT